MGIASLILGIISVLAGWIPVISFLFLIASVVGLILGIVDTVKKSNAGAKKGISIAGIVVNAFAVIIATYMSLASGIGLLALFSVTTL